MLVAGIKGTREITVTESMTAARVGSGELPVYATPMLIALCEETAWKSVAGEMEEGYGTVGGRIELSHLAPSAVGDNVYCETVLTEVDRRRLVFSVRVTAGKDPHSKRLAEGIHERFIINNEKFMGKLQSE